MPQESGSVTTSREARILLRLAGGDATECVVDTGFDGALMLPRSAFARLPAAIVGCLVFEMVGGATMAADVALAEIEWLNMKRTVEVVNSEGNDALIGTELLADCTLVINHVANSVTISTND